MENILISIDHGNSRIKTIHYNFVSGFNKSTVQPPATKDWIYYDGMYYSLTDNRLKYRMDKTQNEDYFILTLFAVAKELQARDIHARRELPIAVAAGLPPKYWSTLKDNFAAYLMNGQELIDFIYNSERFQIRIVSADIYPQAFAAVAMDIDNLSEYPRYYIIDIGGFTVDPILLVYGNPESNSYEDGIIKLYNDAKDQINAKYGARIEDYHVDSVLLHRPTMLSDDQKQLIRNITKAHCDNIMATLRENDIDLTTNPSVFCGGGSILLQEYIKESSYVTNPRIIAKANANVVGYEYLKSLEAI